LVVDERGHILRANKRAEQVFGYESGEMWDLTVETLVPASVRVGHRLLRGQYAENPTPRLMEQNRDLRGLRKDGFEFPVEVGLAPMRSTGKLQFIVTVVDITTRKRAEMELQRYAHIVETSGDMLAFIDCNERYELVNLAYATPYQVTPEKICGQFVKDFLGPASYAVIESRLKAALSGSNQHFVVTREVHQGTYRTLDVDYRVFKPGGKVLGIVAGIRDVTEQVAAEGALRENQRTLERAQAIAHVGSWIADLVTGSFLGSAEARRIIGLPHGPVDAKLVFETCHPEDLQRVEVAWQAAVLGIAPYDIEHRIIVRGDIRWLHVRAEIAFDAQGRAARALGVSQDITEVRTAQFALQEQHHRLKELVAERSGELHEQARYLRALIDNFPFRVWLKDTQGRYLAANRVTADAFGLAVDDMEGKTDFDFFAREIAERRVASDTDVMSSREKMTAEERQPADDALAWFEIYKAPVLDLDGEVLGTVGFARDITAQKTLDTAREQSLSEAIRLAQLRSDFLANMSHEIRTPLNAVLGLAQVGLRHSADRKAHDTFTRILESGQLLLGVINDILDFSKIESGKFVVEQASINPGHSIDRAVGFVASQAFAKGLEFRVRESATLPDSCLGDELRIAQVLVNLLSNAIKFTKEGHVFLDASADQDSLLFQISDSGIGMSVQQMTRLFQPFEQADSSTTRRFGGSGLGLAISRSLVERMGGTIRVESEMGAGSTFEVSLPLINAASVAAPACKTIHMAGFADAEIRFLTAELGARGIAARVLSPATAFDGMPDLVMLDAESIDEATTRAATEAATKGQRLAVVCDPGHRHLLPDFRSDNVESVERPLRVRHILAAYARTNIGLARATDHGPRLGGLHVLAAEDNEVNQLVLTEMLKMEGARVTFGANGLLALESMHAMGERSFDIVLADIQMPEMDGYQMARRIRQLAPTLPIVGLTAHAMPEERQRCLDVGMVAHLPKPIELEALVETIRHFSRRKPDASFTDGTPLSSAASAGPAATADGLPIVDWAALNARFNNKSAFISKLTGIALDSYRSVAPKLTAAVDQQDFESIIFIAHSLKGTSGNLQAKRLYGLAVQVEATSRAKNPEAFKMAAGLLQAVNEVITELDRTAS
jgi:PAS domain S-box-containing protein